MDKYYDIMGKEQAEKKSSYNILYILEIAVDRWNAIYMIRKPENVGFTRMLFGQGFANMRTPKFGTAGFWLAAYEHMRKQSKDMEKRELQMRLANLYLSLLPYKAIRFGGVV